LLDSGIVLTPVLKSGVGNPAPVFSGPGADRKISGATANRPLSIYLTFA
jgi:hypothetical protein